MKMVNGLSLILLKSGRNRGVALLTEKAFNDWRNNTDCLPTLATITVLPYTKRELPAQFKSMCCLEGTECMLQHYSKDKLANYFKLSLACFIPDTSTTQHTVQGSISCV